MTAIKEMHQINESDKSERKNILFYNSNNELKKWMIKF